jgi:hypothetical protein
MRNIVGYKQVQTVLPPNSPSLCLILNFNTTRFNRQVTFICDNGRRHFKTLYGNNQG